MPTSCLWRAITFVDGLCVTVLEECAYPVSPTAAFLEGLLAHELGLFGYIEPTVFWIGLLRQNLVDRASSFVGCVFSIYVVRIYLTTLCQLAVARTLRECHYAEACSLFK